MPARVLHESRQLRFRPHARIAENLSGPRTPLVSVEREAENIHEIQVAQNVELTAQAVTPRFLDGRLDASTDLGLAQLRAALRNRVPKVRRRPIEERSHAGVGKYFQLRVAYGE